MPFAGSYGVDPETNLSQDPKKARPRWDETGQTNFENRKSHRLTISGNLFPLGGDLSYTYTYSYKYVVGNERSWRNGKTTNPITYCTGRKAEIKRKTNNSSEAGWICFSVERIASRSRHRESLREPKNGLGRACPCQRETQHSGAVMRMIGNPWTVRSW